MPQHPFTPPQGRLDHFDLRSTALDGNLLGDPTTRRVLVYLPAGYDDSDEPLPVMVDLAAFSGSGLKRTAWRAFEESLPQRIDRLMATGKMGPAIWVMPDCFTRFGGNQYVDSPAVGGWATFLTRDLLPYIDAHFRTLGGREHRAVFGKSSGGYGALVHGMQYADHWGAVGCLSGDIGWEWGVRAGFPQLATRLHAFGGDPAAFLESVWNGKTLRGSDFHNLLLLCLCATYDPDMSQPYGVRLPFDPHTCVVDEAAWSRWLCHDPLVMLEDAHSQQGLSRLRHVYIDCGDQDEYHLQYGARRFVARMAELSIPVQYEAFTGTHRGTDWRLDTALPALYNAVARPT